MTTDLRDGIARALAWLDAAPPARRELAIVSPFALGSLTRDDVRDVPADVGIRLVRSQPPPATRSFAGPPVLYFDTGVQWRERTIELDGPSTSVRESAGSAAAVPIEIVAPPDVKRAADATLVAVLSRRVFAPAPGRAARVVFAGSKGVTPSILPPAIASWIADAIANITTDEDLQPAGRDPTPFIEASSDGTRLVVTTAWPAAGVRTAMLFRSILNTLALEPDAANRTRASAEREVLPIPDRDLRSWERLAAGVRSPRVETIERDDRRWWWAAALLLLAIETLIRRTQRPQSRQREPLNRVA